MAAEARLVLEPGDQEPCKGGTADEAWWDRQICTMELAARSRETEAG